MPAVRGIHGVVLSVRDARRSAAWWRELLAMELVHENIGGELWPSPWNEVVLRHPEAGFEMSFNEHPQNTGAAFSEFVTGLDHIEFEVSSPGELEEWRDRLDALAIPHSGIQGWRNHVIVARDPDNIQFEFYWPSRG